MRSMRPRPCIDLRSGRKRLDHPASLIRSNSHSQSLSRPYCLPRNSVYIQVGERTRDVTGSSRLPGTIPQAPPFFGPFARIFTTSRRIRASSWCLGSSMPLLIWIRLSISIQFAGVFPYCPSIRPSQTDSKSAPSTCSRKRSIRVLRHFLGAYRLNRSSFAMHCHKSRQTHLRALALPEFEVPFLGVLMVHGAVGHHSRTPFCRSLREIRFRFCLVHSYWVSISRVTYYAFNIPVGMQPGIIRGLATVCIAEPRGQRALTLAASRKHQALCCSPGAKGWAG